MLEGTSWDEWASNGQRRWPEVCGKYFNIWVISVQTLSVYTPAMAECSEPGMLTGLWVTPWSVDPKEHDCCLQAKDLRTQLKGFVQGCESVAKNRNGATSNSPPRVLLSPSIPTHKRLLNLIFWCCFCRFVYSPFIFRSFIFFQSEVALGSQQCESLKAGPSIASSLLSVWLSWPWIPGCQHLSYRLSPFTVTGHRYKWVCCYPAAVRKKWTSCIWITLLSKASFRGMRIHSTRWLHVQKDWSTSC